MTQWLLAHDALDRFEQHCRCLLKQDQTFVRMTNLSRNFENQVPEPDQLEYWNVMFQCGTVVRVDAETVKAQTSTKDAESCAAHCDRKKKRRWQQEQQTVLDMAIDTLRRGASYVEIACAGEKMEMSPRSPLSEEEGSCESGDSTSNDSSDDVDHQEADMQERKVHISRGPSPLHRTAGRELWMVQWSGSVRDIVNLALVENGPSLEAMNDAACEHARDARRIDCMFLQPLALVDPRARATRL